MSECSKEQIKCPRCHYDSPMTVWHSINVDLDPDLKEKLLESRMKTMMLLFNGVH